MAQRYSLGVRSTIATIAAAQYEVYNLTRPFEVREIEIFLVAATLSVLGIGRPAALGVTPTTPVTFLPGSTVTADLIRASTTKCAVAWGTPPTVPANFFRRGHLPATVGASVLWKFEPGELVVAAGASLVIWNITAASAGLDINFSIDE